MSNNPFESRSYNDEQEYARRVLREVQRMDPNDSLQSEEQPIAPQPEEEEELLRQPYIEPTKDEEEEPELTSEEEKELKLKRERAEKIARRQERMRQLEANPVWQFISGNILLSDSFADAYKYLGCIGVALLLSVMTIFYAFHLDMRNKQLSNQVQLLREQSLDYQSRRFSQTSHSAIIKRLEERGIELYDPQEAKVVIKSGSFF